MADRDGLVDQFINVTGVDTNRARFYLESAAWDLELATSTFFEGGDNDDIEIDELNAPSGVDLSSNEDASMPTESSRNPSATTSVNRFGTLRSMNVESDSSEEEGQAYYAGGSDRSGQQVLGPPKKKKDSNKLVDSLFKSAKEHGAEEKNEEDRSSASKRSTFAGAGYRLGETNDDTTVVPGMQKRTTKEQVDKKLKLWKNGFSVDDGPLRDYNDPQNKQFLDSISRGEVPQDLVREARGGEVNLDMEDHRNEDFIKPKSSIKAFSGAGHMLGSPAPTVTAAEPPAGDQAPSPIQVNPQLPTTSVQLRLADGTRLVLKMNHSHRVSDIRQHIIVFFRGMIQIAGVGSVAGLVSDIRQHIIVTNPQYSQTNFCLMTTFPNKELSDETQTLSEGQLLNAVIVQRLK